MKQVIFSSDITSIYQVKHRNIIIIRYIAFQKHCKIISEKAFFNIVGCMLFDLFYLLK